MGNDMIKNKPRLVFLDISKGILIYLVVIGHIVDGGTNLHHYIFWFHMPVFLMISGMFLKSSFDMRDEVRRKFKRLIIPYLFFSFLLGTISRNGLFLKQFLGTVWGGYANITYSTFPYYFIQLLFCSIILYYVIVQAKVSVKAKWTIAFILYAMMHIVAILVPHNILGWIPWSIDVSFYALIYLMLGKELAKRKIDDKWIWWSVLLLAVLCISDAGNIYRYSYDLKGHQWVFGLDMVVPIACMLVLFVISKKISKIPYISSMLSYIGRGSLVVLLLHPFFNHIYQQVLGDANVIIQSLVNVFSCMVVYWVLSSNRYTRIIIGESNYKLK